MIRTQETKDYFTKGGVVMSNQKETTTLNLAAIFGLALMGMCITVVTPAMGTFIAQWPEHGPAGDGMYAYISTLPTLMTLIYFRYWFSSSRWSTSSYYRWFFLFRIIYSCFTWYGCWYYLTFRKCVDYWLL